MRRGDQSKSARSRGQSTMEMALIAPLLVMLLSVIIEGGLALNAWLRVNTAARDATRFAMDAGRPDQTRDLVLNKLTGIDFGSNHSTTNSTWLDVFIITGATDNTGNIATWTVDHQYGTGTPKVARSIIQSRLRSQGAAASQNIPFTIVEVDYQYQPLLGTLVPRGAKIPMSSYAIVQQY